MTDARPYLLARCEAGDASSSAASMCKPVVWLCLGVLVVSGLDTLVKDGLTKPQQEKVIKQARLVCCEETWCGQGKRAFGIGLHLLVRHTGQQWRICFTCSRRALELHGAACVSLLPLFYSFFAPEPFWKLLKASSPQRPSRIRVALVALNP